MMRTWGRGLILALGLALGAVPEVEARDLVVGVEAIDYSPLYGVKDDRFVGAAREILDAFATARGYRLTYRPLPVKRLLAELIHGGIDLKFPDSPDWQQAMRQGHAIRYSRPVIAYVDGTMVTKDRVGAGVEALRSLGTVAGFTPFAWSERIKAGQVALKENPSFDQLLRQVQTGRVDGAYVNIAVALHSAEGGGGLVFDRSLPFIADSYHLSSAKAPEVIAEFDEWLAGNAKLIADIIARTGAEKGVR